MNGGELRDRLDCLKLTQVEFARLLGVTPRAVNMWVTGKRKVPSTATAYLRDANQLGDRIAVTVLLPPTQAKALQQAAACAGMLDGTGRVVMDHFILAHPRMLPKSPQKASSEGLLEAHFNGA